MSEKNGKEIDRLLKIIESIARIDAKLTGLDEKQKADCFSIKEFFENSINELEKNIETKYGSLKEATTLAKTTMDERLARMNEFRESLKDQANSFVTKNEHEILIKKIDSELDILTEEVKNLREFKAELKGKADQSQVIFSLMIGLAGIIIGVIAFLRR